MNEQYQAAVDWALTQNGVVIEGNIDNQNLVDEVRGYFNNHKIEYFTFSFVDLVPYLPVSN